MAGFKDAAKGALVRGLAVIHAISVVDVKWHGLDVLEVFFTDAIGKPWSALAYRDQEHENEIAEIGARWLSGPAIQALRILLSPPFRHGHPHVAGGDLGWWRIVSALYVSQRFTKEPEFFMTTIKRKITELAAWGSRV